MISLTGLHCRGLCICSQTSSCSKVSWNFKYLQSHFEILHYIILHEQFKTKCLTDRKQKLLIWWRLLGYRYLAEIHLCVKWGRMFERGLLSSQSLVNIMFCEKFCICIQICNWIFWLMNALLMCPCLYTALTFLLPKIYICIYIYYICIYIVTYTHVYIYIYMLYIQYLLDIWYVCINYTTLWHR